MLKVAFGPLKKTSVPEKVVESHPDVRVIIEAMANKVLNPHLFSSNDPFMVEEAPQWASEKDTLIAMEKMTLQAQWEEEILNVKKELTSLSRSVVQNDHEWQKRTERLELIVKKLQTQQTEFQQDMTSQWSTVKSQARLSDGIEEKVQGVLDKHQQTLRTFEVRMQQLQQMVREKDDQIRQMQNLVHGYRNELARMKKL